MLIGDLAQLTGAPQKAIRHYEALGLLGHVARRGRYRHYSEQNLQQVRLIRQAQSLGLRLVDLGRLPGVAAELDWSAVLALVAEKQAAIAAQIADLQARLTALDQVRQEILGCDAVRPAGYAQACAASTWTP